jgi:hypothetical protein
MCNGNERLEHCEPGKACALCGGKFGLIRYYSCRTALCSKQCLARLRARRERDRQWLFRVYAAASVDASSMGLQQF